MAQYLKTTWFGVFVYDEDGLIDRRLFPREAAAIAARLRAMEDGRLLEEEQALAHRPLLVDDPRLADVFTRVDAAPPLPVQPQDEDFPPSLLQEASLMLAQHRMQAERGERKRRLAQAIHAVDDLLKTSNLLTERLTEWYGYFSLELVPHRQVLSRIRDWSLGGDEALDVEEEAALKHLAAVVEGAEGAQQVIEQYVRDTMEQLAPNVSSLVGETIAARLIAAAGGLDKLAEMPSGTIQVLGAEKALFRHIKEGTPPPKHGIIFQHEMVNRAPRKHRGKIARTLAGKIAIAARADAFTGRRIAQQLKEELEKRVAEIRG
ncbi:MAG: hypothetical protein PHZ19_03840 [Candidatus Thermoplasmatota archaeon]|nr:hypothetical protein [Candidatus Thermoplasmatota archaeon]